MTVRWTRNTKHRELLNVYICCAGTASAPSPSGASVPPHSASASTAQQIQATGPAAVAAVRAMQATAVGTSGAASKEATASGEGTDSGEVQGLEDEPAAGEGEPHSSLPSYEFYHHWQSRLLCTAANFVSWSFQMHAVGYDDSYKILGIEQACQPTYLSFSYWMLVGQATWSLQNLHGSPAMLQCLSWFCACSQVCLS